MGFPIDMWCGIQQAKEYAQTLGLKFAYATNGEKIIEHNFLNGKETEIEKFPTPDDLWVQIRTSEGIQDDLVAERFREGAGAERQRSTV